MKRISLLLGTSLSFLLLFGFVSLSAQSNPTVSQKITDKNGEVTVKKKRLAEGESIEDYMRAMQAEFPDAQNVEVTIKDDNSTMTFSDNTFAELEEAMEGLEQEIERSVERKMKAKHKHRHNHQHNHQHNHYRSDKDDRENNDDYIVTERPLLGIYPDYTSRGVEIGSLVSNGGAKDAGLQSGDLIQSINGKELQNGHDLRAVLAEYEPGETVTVAYERNGQSYTTRSTLTGKKSYTKRRDPCKIFIGVTLGGAKNGVKVDGIIAGTAADKSELQAGDIITAMDGIAVNSFNELLVERNKHEPGDPFILSVLRDGQSRSIDAQFLSCEEEENEEEPIEEEIMEPENTNDLPIEFTNNEVELGELRAFPNPTYGKLNLEFVGEAAPTTVQITDISGKRVYFENINNFDGYYQQQLMIENATPGNMIVTIQQAGKVISQQVLLLPRA